MEALWSHRVEGDAFRHMVVDFDGVRVSTGQQTLVVSREGDVVGRYEPPVSDRGDARVSVLVGDSRCALEEGDLLKIDALGSPISRTAIRSDLIERQLEGVIGRATQGLPLDIAQASDDQTRWRWWTTGLVADSDRKRLLVMGLIIPWLAALRTDGHVEWVRLGHARIDCCNSAAVVASDGTVAHFSSCGRWITLLTTEGNLMSSHDIDGAPTQLFTNGHGVAYVVDLDGRLLAYRPGVGLAFSVEVPHLWHADVRDGILYTVIRHPADGMLVMAFQEPG